MNSQQELLDTINSISQSQDRSLDTPATVLRIEEDTVWVHIDGGADETPVQKTINCIEGDTVQVRISNGSAFLVGNATAPPTDDAVANVAHFVAEQADEKATEANETVKVLEVEVDGKVDVGDSNIQHLSSTMYQNANGVNIFNDTLAVGDSYAHIDGDSFDIKQATTAGTIDDVNDEMIASFGREVTIGTRGSGAVGDYSMVLGRGCVAAHSYSHAEGNGTTASGMYSHAEGHETLAYGEGAHAEGSYAQAIGDGSHAETNGHAVGGLSHAEGNGCYANGYSSHAEGNATEANGDSSHAEGNGCYANGDFSHAQNHCTLASSKYQTAMGRWNIEDTHDTYALIIGNGTETGGVIQQSNAMCVTWSGHLLIPGDVKSLNGNRKYVAEPSSEGTSGQVLATDGNGGRSWVSVSGGGPTVLTSTTISASDTTYTFTDNRILADSVIDVYDTIFGFAPTNINTVAGSCTVTFPAQSSTHTMKNFVY